MTGPDAQGDPPMTGDPAACPACAELGRGDCHRAGRQAEREAAAGVAEGALRAVRQLAWTRLADLVDAVALELLMQSYTRRDGVTDAHARNRWTLTGYEDLRGEYRTRARAVLAVVAGIETAAPAGDPAGADPEPTR